MKLNPIIYWSVCVFFLLYCVKRFEFDLIKNKSRIIKTTNKLLAKEIFLRSNEKREKIISLVPKVSLKESFTKDEHSVTAQKEWRACGCCKDNAFQLWLITLSWFLVSGAEKRETKKNNLLEDIKIYSRFLFFKWNCKDLRLLDQKQPKNSIQSACEICVICYWKFSMP